jgi:hypothetical protein
VPSVTAVVDGNDAAEGGLQHTDADSTGLAARGSGRPGRHCFAVAVWWLALTDAVLDTPFEAVVDIVGLK